ncbi:MAG: TonB-dependent receptor plug domain-containing protein, partial [Ginsengibacter sp.]
MSARSQSSVKGSLVDDKTNLPVAGATITLMPADIFTVTDDNGRFLFKGKYDTSSYIIVNNIGYASKNFSANELQKNSAISITQTQIALENVVIVSNAGDIYKPISRTDIAMRGVNNSQEVLRIVPGIVIGQHQGGGKAEQIFLRGFDADHGTDFRLDVDGLPINMVSHAHGQGFADSHFIIPETIESVDFKKGPYAANKGDFATTGFVDF